MDNKNYIKIQVKGILNFEELTSEYRISKKDIIDFHNSHCKLHEILPYSLTKQVEFIYLPIENYSSRQEQLLPTNTLDLQENTARSDYGVIIKYQPKDLQIHYKLEMLWNQNKVEIKKGTTFINNNEADKIIEQLFEKAEKSLYPLLISINKNGQIEKILNGAEIKKRWLEEHAPKIKEYYQSDITDRIIKQFDEVFSNINRKQALIERSLFYKLFFFPVFRRYNDFKYETDAEFYFSPFNRNIYYNIQYQLDKEFSRGGKIILRLAGIEKEYIFSKGRSKGKIDLLYKFEKETHEIFSITGTISGFEKEQEHIIEFQLYKLNNSY